MPYREDPIAIPGYAIGESIGSGGFGEVFRARHELMGRDVAIKVLQRRYSSDPDAVARFIAEARAASRIKHPGIVDVFDFGTLGDGRHYCVMELIPGTTLREFMKARDRLTLAEALPILRGIAEAVDAAHAAGIAHRDLKPDNVFLVAGGIKLIDFGLAKLIADEAPMTATGAVFGTPQYMSPEQCRGRASDPRTDVYTFGVLVYQLLTGELPFTGDALEIALQHLNDPPEPPSAICAELPPHVDRVILALLAKDPENRPTPLVRMVDALAGDAPAPRLPRSPRRKWPAVAIAGILAVGGAVAWLATNNRRPSSAPSCPSGEDRLAGVWDLAAKRAPAIDAYAASWVTAWNATCRTPDPDPLIAAQRAGCLDDARLELGGVAQALDAVDVEAPELPSLADCEKPAVLRARVHGSPGDGRRAMELLAKARRAHVKFRSIVAAGATGKNLLDEASGLVELANDLTTMYPHGANAIRRDRAASMPYARASDAIQRDFYRQAINNAIKGARESRDDDALAADLALLAEFELAAGDLANAEAALADGAAALVRSGTPELSARWLARARAAVDAARGPLESTGCGPPRDPNARGRFTVYINTEGVRLVRGTVDDSRINQSTLLEKTPSLEITPMLQGRASRTSFIAAMTDHVRHVLAPYSVDIVTRRPESGDYMMVVIGDGDFTPLGTKPGNSLTPFHCEPIPNAIDLIWATPEISPDSETVGYADSILSDIGTMFGLTATTTPHDCMCRFGDACDRGPQPVECTFGVGPTQTVANCDRTTQDEPAMLRAAIGCR